MISKILNTFDISSIYKVYSSDRDIYDIVYYAVKATGNVSNKKANYITNEILDKVASLSNADFSNDANAHTQKIIDDFMASYIDHLDDDVRYVFLHQLKFGLSLYTSDEAVRRLEDGASCTELFEQYYAEFGEAANFSESYLKNEIKEIIANHRISPLCMKRLTENLNTDNVLERSVGTGKNAQRLICIVAAVVYYASDGEITVDDLAKFMTEGTSALENLNYTISSVDSISWRAHEIQNLLFFGGLLFTAVVTIVLVLAEAPLMLVFAVSAALLYASFKVPPVVKKLIKAKAAEYAFSESQRENPGLIERHVRRFIGMDEGCFKSEEDIDTSEEEDEEDEEDEEAELA